METPPGGRGFGQRLTQIQNLEHRNLLSWQERLGKIWDKRAADPYAFTPHEWRDKVTLEESLRKNKELGVFGTKYLIETAFRGNPEVILDRLKEGRKVLAGGYGKGFDSPWLKEATL